MQSSSEGDEEFHSRSGSESISSFLDPPPHGNNNFNTLTTQNQHFLTHNQNPSTFFNPQTLDHHHHHHHNPNFSQPNLTTNHYNNDQLIWSSTGLRSEPNYGNFTNIPPSSSSTPPRTTQPISSTQGPFPGPSLPAPPSRTEHEAHTYRAAPDQLPSVIKNPKKRTRASRRAPTTVLTTDTTNFRNMVQEFTGIPAVPFSGSPYSRRLDLFSALRPGSNIDGFGPLYPLRPAAHKFTPPFGSSSPQSLLNSAMVNSTNDNTVGGSASNNQNFTPDHVLNQLHRNQNISLQSFGNLMGGGGFPSQETRSDSVRRNNDDDDGGGSVMRRWGRGGRETVRNPINSDDGVQENNVVVQSFDGNVNSGGESVHQQQQQQQLVSGGGGGVGYNLNVVSENNNNNNNSNSVVVSAGAADQGNVASWICTSD